MIKLQESRFQTVYAVFRNLQKEKDVIGHKMFEIERKIESLDNAKNRALKDHKEKAKIEEKKILLKFNNIWNYSSEDSCDAYQKIRFMFEDDEIIAGDNLEKKLSKFPKATKYHVRALMVERNNLLRIQRLKPRIISKKYPTNALSDELRDLNDKYYKIIRKIDPFLDAVKVADKNRRKVKELKIKLRSIKKSQKELGKQKPEWKGMSYADEYYDKKENISDKIIDLDIKKQDLEKEINKIVKETNEVLFKVDLRV